jgi:hypothetical protein
MPEGPIVELASPSADIELPMERPLFTPPMRARIDDRKVAVADEDVDTEALFRQWAVDKAALCARIRQALASRDQVLLSELVAEYPLERGLTELVAYLSLASEDRNAVFSEAETDRLSWTDEEGSIREAEIPRVVFAKEIRSHAEP